MEDNIYSLLNVAIRGSLFLFPPSPPPSLSFLSMGVKELSLLLATMQCVRCAPRLSQPSHRFNLGQRGLKQ